MATFELNSETLNTGRPGRGERFESRNAVSAPKEPAAEPECENMEIAHGAIPHIKQESIITLKVYDACRLQDCLDENDLGPARSAIDQYLGPIHYREGEIIYAPDNAATVSIEDLRVKKIIIVSKRHNPFKRGFWNIDLKYVFEYTLVFREAGGAEIGCLYAVSIHNQKVTLFGSVGTDIVTATDLFKAPHEESHVMGSDPFVLVEAKAVPLSAKLRHGHGHNDHDDCRPRPSEVFVTIGLYSMIKLYRLVTLMVESRGFAVPKPYKDIDPVNICRIFDNMPFPMDIFAPPQKREFDSGKSGDIPKETAACAESEE